ncbi:MAG: hypothetical protein H8K10_14950 [Nitrospira sp.]|nr:hypothetical protein [Nitrospira sp.]
MTRAAMRRRGMGAVGLALCGVLSGCAVLTVDVDVYKGALVNEEHVQLHQLVALATAAKPMLIQLRDNLEWPDTDGKPIADDKPPEPEKCLKGDIVTRWYQGEYVQPPAGVDYMPEVPSQSIFRKTWEGIKEFFTGPRPSCQPHFKRPYARHVNDVLSLYEDLDSPVFAPYGKRLREVSDRLRRMQGIVEFSEARDRQIFAEIEQGLKQDLLAGVKGSEGTQVLPDLQALLRAYRNFLVPTEGGKGKSKREVGQLMDALKKVVKEGTTTQPPEKSMELALIQEWQGSASYDNPDKQLYDRRLPFRAVWKLLGEQHTQLDKATRQLCVDGPQGDEACRQLNKRTKELADAYWESRQAVRDLWEESLNLLLRIERVKREEREEPGRYDALEKKVIRLAVKVTSVRQIASALSRLRDAGTCSVLENVLTREWKQTCEGGSKETEEKATKESKSSGTISEKGSTGPAWTEENVNDKQEHFETILTQAFSSAPADTALFLLALDNAEKQAAPPKSVAKTLVEKANRVNDQRIVRLGLNRIFFEGNGSGKDSEKDEVVQAMEDVKRDLAHGFGRGRLLDGLHTLTENYLDSHNRAKSCVAFESQQQRCAESDDQRRLLDGLVEFAQKLLFLANHDSLASPPGTEGLIVGGGKNILRGLFGDDAIAGYEKTSVIGQSHAPQAMTKRYVRVLQAVGNSILFSANELRERDRYREQSQKRVPAEIQAVNAVYQPDPRKILNDLLKELAYEQVIAQQRLDEAKAKKAAIDGQIKNAAALKTEADDEVNKATQALNDYRTKLSPLKAIHDLVTPQVAEQIKARWKAAGLGEAADLVAFLTGPDGLEQQLTTIRQAQDGTPTPEERSLFDQAIAYAKDPESKTGFEAYRRKQGHTSSNRAELLAVFTKHLDELEAARAARVTQYDKIREEREQARRDVQDKTKQLSAEAAGLAAVIAELPVTKARLATAATVIDAVKGEVLKAAPTDAPYVSPDTIYALLASHVQHKEAAEQDAAKKKAYQDTQAVLAKRTPPPSLPPLKDGDYNSPVDVMDRVIALLRHREMEAVERYGQDSTASKQAAEALENAYQHRVGMTYLRPSSAYLRTSFPSTSLQDDPNLAWDNMLLSQGIRSLPFSSQLVDILNPSERQDRTLTAELDKQYWQNINRVRVSGAGFTNQALVKDDVGNWYVKQYFGDTKDIVKSAKHLALFGLGTKLPIDLSHELRQLSGTKDDSKKTAAEKEAELPPLQQVFGKHKAAYQAHTVELSTRLAELHGKDGDKALYNQILAGWERHDELKNNPAAMTALKTALGEEVAQWDKHVEPLKKASDQERGLAITNDLKALAKLEKRLSARIEQDVKAESSKAASEVRKVVGAELLGMLKDHKQALDRYEQAVLFIGDAANPKDPQQEQGK